MITKLLGMACWVQKKRGSGSSIFLLDSKQKRQPIESKECIREVVRICTYLAWLWLFTFPCSFILVSCCLLLFYKGAIAKDESVHITKAVVSRYLNKYLCTYFLFNEY